MIEVYRQKRLEGPHEVESVTESAVICMQECAKRFALACRMFEYSAKDQMCRFSSDFVQQRALISGASHLLQDAQFDFYHVISCK